MQLIHIWFFFEMQLKTATKQLKLCLVLNYFFLHIWALLTITLFPHYIRDVPTTKVNDNEGVNEKRIALKTANYTDTQNIDKLNYERKTK